MLWECRKIQKIYPIYVVKMYLRFSGFFVNGISISSSCICYCRLDIFQKYLPQPCGYVKSVELETLTDIFAKTKSAVNQPEDTKQQMAVLSRSLKSYKRLRRNPHAVFDKPEADSAASARSDHKKVSGEVRQN